MTNGAQVTAFERELASYCGAKFAICAGNGTVTLQAALVALGIKPGNKVATTPLTHSATTIAILNVGAIPVYCDIDPDTWLMNLPPAHNGQILGHTDLAASIPVSLYGLSQPYNGLSVVDDAAQTLRKHSDCAFTSLSMQASKILNLGEGGALLTDDEELASKARSYLSLGYKMSASQARIDPATLKAPDFERHHFYPAINGRLNDITAAQGIRMMRQENMIQDFLDIRSDAAGFYRQTIQGCDWITPQFVPEGYQHDMWSYAVALKSKDLWHPFTDSIVKHGGERPFGAWRLTYQEPAFRHLVKRTREIVLDDGCDCDIDHPYPGGIPTGVCPIAEYLQPRIIQSQTNSLASAEKNAEAWLKAIKEIGG